MTDRDENGRFVKGHSMKSPGRPPRAKDEEYQAILYEVVPLERWRKMLEAQAKRAEKGEIKAFNAIADRLMPVVNKNEHTGKDGAPLEIRTFDYAAAIASIATGSSEDSDTSGEG